MGREPVADRVVVVTGGGRGLGRAYCLAIAAHGARVVVADMDRGAADEVVAAIEADGGTALAACSTVATREGAEAIVEACIERFGALDAVVNNAGVMRNGFFEDQTPEMLETVLDVHVRGSFYVTQAAWPHLRKSGHGRVVMTSSAGGLFAMPGEANYAIAKAGMYGLTRALSMEGAPHGILVNAILPHAATNISAETPLPGHKERYRPGVQEALLPFRTTDAVAPFVVFLSSPLCELNGEAFAVGSGRFARVFVGETQGWVAPAGTPVGVDDLVAHLGEIRDRAGYHVPEDLYAEIELFAAARGWSP